MKISRLRLVWNVCQLLSMAAALASLFGAIHFFFQTAKPSDSHILRIAGAFSIIVVPILVKAFSFHAFLQLVSGLGAIKKSAVRTSLRYVSRPPQSATGTTRFGRWLAAFAGLNFMMFVGLNQYVTTFPIVDVALPGGTYTTYRGQIYEIPVVLYNIMAVLGPVMLISYILTIGMFFIHAVVKFVKRRQRQSLNGSSNASL